MDLLLYFVFVFSFYFIFRRRRRRSFHIGNYDVNYLNYLSVSVQRVQRHTHTCNRNLQTVQKITSPPFCFTFDCWGWLAGRNGTHTHTSTIWNEYVWSKLNNNFIYDCAVCGRDATNGERIKTNEKFIRKREVDTRQLFVGSLVGSLCGALLVCSKSSEERKKKCD